MKEEIVTEIMNNPEYASDAHGEWLELFNTGIVDVDLRGWSLSDDGSDGFVITGSLVLGGGDRVVLADNTDPAINGSVPVDFRYGGNMTLGNDVDQIVVRSPEGTEIDRVAYDDGVEFPDPAGRSMSLSPGAHTGAANSVGTNWCAATHDRLPFDYATPGDANDACAP